MEPEITELIHRWQRGEADAAETLFAHTFRLLRRAAARQLRGQHLRNEWQPTDLVQEGVLRLLRHVPREIADRHHFLAIANGAMRQALAERARRAGALKRPPVADRRALPTELVDLTSAPDSLIDLDRAIERLAALDPRQATIARLHLQGECSLEACGAALGLSRSTARRAWRGARLWLKRELNGYFHDR